MLVWTVIVTPCLAAPPVGSVASGAAPNGGSAGGEVFVEVSGDVPGFADPHQLASFLADKMSASVPARHFAAAPAGKALPADRIEWKFKTLRVVWGGGSHNGFPQPFASRSYLSAEVRLYLDGQYQMTMLSQSTVANSSPEAELATMIAKVSRSIAAAADKL
jgi:hypothetical protein